MLNDYFSHAMLTLNLEAQEGPTSSAFCLTCPAVSRACAPLPPPSFTVPNPLAMDGPDVVSQLIYLEREITAAFGNKLLTPGMLLAMTNPNAATLSEAVLPPSGEPFDLAFCVCVYDGAQLLGQCMCSPSWYFITGVNIYRTSK